MGTTVLTLLTPGAVVRWEAESVWAGKWSWSHPRPLLSSSQAHTEGFWTGPPEQRGLPAPISALFLSQSRPSPPPTPEGDGREEGLQPKDASPAGLARVKWQLPGGAELSSLV